MQNLKSWLSRLKNTLTFIFKLDVIVWNKVKSIYIRMLTEWKEQLDIFIYHNIAYLNTSCNIYLKHFLQAARYCLHMKLSFTLDQNLLSAF
jgi:hypothetical protein